MIVRDRIQHALDTWKEPDPHVIARRLLGKLEPEERDQLVLAALVDQVRLMIRMERQSTGNGEPHPVGRSRWAQFSQRVHVAGAWKLLADCTVEDVDELAVQSDELAAQNAAWAARWRALASRMRTAGASVVSDLDDDDVEGLAA